ncbi:MAG: glycosyltransferase family protein [Thermodesulfobacteriota bacterium]
MRVLLGIQGTGNGHISRSRELLKHLLKRTEVDVLVSGYHHEVDLGFEVKYKLPGLGFTFGKRGGIDYWNSIRNFSPYTLLSDIYKIPVDKYDLVVSDFEPVCAWSSKLKRVPCVSISHQASFLSLRIPRPRKKNRIQELIIKWYAPSRAQIGLHFKEYDDFIFTPIIREEIRNTDVKNNGHYTVYLPSYDYSFLSGVLKKIDVKWEVFSKHHKGESFKDANVTVYPVNNRDFVRSLSTCEGILCNAGFETPAETLYLGKKLLVIPMRRQYEQQCNAEALGRLGIPVIRGLGDGFENNVSDWINSTFVYNANYKNNLPLIVERILDSTYESRSLNNCVREPDAHEDVSG